MLPLLLASASPRRREILTTLGIPFRAAAADVDETALPGEPASAYLDRIVAAKLVRAESIVMSLGLRAMVVADTTVVIDERMLAKPANAAENREMLRSLSGRSHSVMTRFAASIVGGSRYAETVSTQVTMRSLSDDEIAGYADSGEGLDKAGGYAIQGMGAFAVVSIHGSYSNVVGLPAAELILALKNLGIVPRFPFVPRS